MSAIRQQIMEAVETLCGTITTANGYLTNIGSDVLVNPDKEWEPASQDYPTGIIIRETASTHMPGMIGEDFGTLDVDVHIHSQAYRESEPQDTVRNGFIDLIEAIGMDKTFGGLADDCVVSNAPAVEVQRGKRNATLTVSFRIQFRTTRWAAATAPA